MSARRQPAPRELLTLMSRLRALLALTAVLLGAATLTGCGQTGPLVLPGGSNQSGNSQGASGQAGENDQGEDEDGAENER